MPIIVTDDQGIEQEICPAACYDGLFDPDNMTQAQIDSICNLFSCGPTDVDALATALFIACNQQSIAPKYQNPILLLEEERTVSSQPSGTTDYMLAPSMLEASHNAAILQFNLRAYIDEIANTDINDVSARVQFSTVYNSTQEFYVIAYGVNNVAGIENENRSVIGGDHTVLVVGANPTSPVTVTYQWLFQGLPQGSSRTLLQVYQIGSMQTRV